MNDLKILDSAMKTPGWIESTKVRCGKQGCKCTQKELHGPYFYYRYWKLYHKTWIQKKKYINKDVAEKLTRVIEKYHETTSLIGENPYRAVRRGVKLNIKNGVTGMTQRRLAKVSALVQAFI